MNTCALKPRYKLLGFHRRAESLTRRLSEAGLWPSYRHEFEDQVWIGTPAGLFRLLKVSVAPYGSLMYSDGTQWLTAARVQERVTP